MVLKKVSVNAYSRDPLESQWTQTRSRPQTFRAYVSKRVHDRMQGVKKCQFLVILIICVGILGFQAAQCVEKYVDGSTGTADKYVHVSKTSFPVLTICPTYPYDLAALQSYGIATKTEIQFRAQWVANDSSVDALKFYEDVTLKLEDIVVSVLVNAELQIEGSNNILLGPNDKFCGESIFHVKEYYFNGDCFALDLPKCLKEAGVLEVVLTFKNKTDIFIHHEGQFLSPNSRSRVDVDLGHFVKIAVNHEVVQLLGTDGTCVNGQIGYDSCIYNTLRDVMLKEYGCTVPWLPEKNKICVTESDRQNVFDLYQKNRRNQKNICPNSCLFTNMYFGPPVTGSNNNDEQDIAKAVFYFRRDIKTTTEYFLYSILSMVAEIGGYVGLLLGVSLFKLADINNVFIDWYASKASEEEEWEKDHQNKVQRFTRADQKGSSLYI